MSRQPCEEGGRATSSAAGKQEAQGKNIRPLEELRQCWGSAFKVFDALEKHDGSVMRYPGYDGGLVQLG